MKSSNMTVNYSNFPTYKPIMPSVGSAFRPFTNCAIQNPHTFQNYSQDTFNWLYNSELPAKSNKWIEAEQYNASQYSPINYSNVRQLINPYYANQFVTKYPYFLNGSFQFFPHNNSQINMRKYEAEMLHYQYNLFNRYPSNITTLDAMYSQPQFPNVRDKKPEKHLPASYLNNNDYSNILPVSHAGLKSIAEDQGLKRSYSQVNNDSSKFSYLQEKKSSIDFNKLHKSSISPIHKKETEVNKRRSFTRYRISDILATHNNAVDNHNSIKSWQAKQNNCGPLNQHNVSDNATYTENIIIQKKCKSVKRKHLDNSLNDNGCSQTLITIGDIEISHNSNGKSEIKASLCSPIRSYNNFDIKTTIQDDLYAKHVVIEATNKKITKNCKSKKRKCLDSLLVDNRCSQPTTTEDGITTRSQPNHDTFYFPKNVDNLSDKKFNKINRTESEKLPTSQKPITNKQSETNYYSIPVTDSSDKLLSSIRHALKLLQKKSSLEDTKRTKNK